MRRILALAAACSLVAGAAWAQDATTEAAPEYQLDTAFVCGSALDSQGYYADNLISWLQGRCQDGFIGADVCKEINHYVTAYSAQVKEQVGGCREKIGK
jgi:hypothetical protein